MRIAVVSTGTLHGSGFATRVCSMLEAYADAGHEVDLFHARFPVEQAPPSSVQDRLHAYFWHEIPYGDRRSNHLHVYPPLMRACDRIAGEWTDLQRAGQYHVVQCEAVNVWSLARRIEGTKRVLVVHDDDWVRCHRIAQHAPDPLRRATRELSALKYKALQWRFAARADTCWFASEVEMRRALASNPRISALLVPNGASDRYFELDRSPAEAGPVATFVGPTVNMSNVDSVQWLVGDIWPRVAAAVPDAELRLLGAGWEEFVPPDGGLRISTPGYVPDLPGEIDASRLALAALRSGGGTKLKVVEAMAGARPVVATPVGAEGLPASPGIAIAETSDALARSIERWLTDPTAAARAGVANRQAVGGLRWSDIWGEALGHLEHLVAAELVAS